MRHLEQDPIFANALVPFSDNKSRRCGKTSRPMERKKKEEREREKEKRYTRKSNAIL